MCAVGRSGHAWFKLLPTEHVTSQRNERSNARIVIDNKFTSRHASRAHIHGRGRLYIVTDSRIVPNDAVLIKFDCRGYVGARAAERGCALITTHNRDMQDAADPTAAAIPSARRMISM